MQINEKLTFIQLKAQEHIAEINERISWSAHAVIKMRAEGLRKNDIEQSLRSCAIIEDYDMQGRPFPGCLVLSWIDANPVHSVIAIDQRSDRIFIITVYKPSSARWLNDWKTRKQ